MRSKLVVAAMTLAIVGTTVPPAHAFVHPIRVVGFKHYFEGSKQIIQGDVRTYVAKCRKNRKVDIYVNGGFVTEWRTDSIGRIGVSEMQQAGQAWKVKIPRNDPRSCGGFVKSFTGD